MLQLVVHVTILDAKILIYVCFNFKSSWWPEVMNNMAS